jgi:hypothetical protein
LPSVKIRLIFDSIDEGFCTIEVLFDANDKPIDYRFLEVNPRLRNRRGFKRAGQKNARDCPAA